MAALGRSLAGTLRQHSVFDLFARQIKASFGPSRLAVGLVDAESGQSLPAGADAERVDYQARLAAWRGRLRQSLVGDGIEPVSLTTADRLDYVLRRFLLARRGGA